MAGETVTVDKATLIAILRAAYWDSMFVQGQTGGDGADEEADQARIKAMHKDITGEETPEYPAPSPAEQARSQARIEYGSNILPNGTYKLIPIVTE